jgi:hypothetical protein
MITGTIFFFKKGKFYIENNIVHILNLLTSQILKLLNYN